MVTGRIEPCIRTERPKSIPCPAARHSAWYKVKYELKPFQYSRKSELFFKAVERENVSILTSSYVK